MAPYHVLLATRVGQRRLFERFGLEELEFSVSEPERATWHKRSYYLLFPSYACPVSTLISGRSSRIGQLKQVLPILMARKTGSRRGIRWFSLPYNKRASLRNHWS